MAKVSEFTKVCRDCGKLIKFRTDVRALNGTLKPLELTEGTERHACSNSQWQRRQNAVEGKQEPSKEDVQAYFNQERIVLDVMSAVVDANQKLDTFFLKLERVPKTDQQTTVLQSQEESLGDNCKK